MIIGGFAASYWGKPRFTADFDYVIDSRTYELAKSLLEELGYELLYLHPKSSFAHFGSKANFRVDLMMVDNKTWTELKESAAGSRIRESLAYRFLVKCHSRDSL